MLRQLRRHYATRDAAAPPLYVVEADAAYAARYASVVDAPLREDEVMSGQSASAPRLCYAALPRCWRERVAPC